MLNQVLQKAQDATTFPDWLAQQENHDFLSRFLTHVSGRQRLFGTTVALEEVNVCTHEIDVVVQMETVVW